MARSLNSDAVICSAGALGTVVLILLPLWLRRSRPWRTPILVSSAMAIVALHGIGNAFAGAHLRCYLYRGVDPSVVFVECPFKGRPFDSLPSNTVIYRTFQKQWWNFYRWRDYATHPRWRLPYKVDERQLAPETRDPELPA